jgi:hypothetical protein
MTTSKVRDLDGTFDEVYADLRETNDDAVVTYEPCYRETIDRVVIRRTVTRKAARRSDQVILWESDDVMLHPRAVAGFVADLVREAVR